MEGIATKELNSPDRAAPVAFPGFKLLLAYYYYYFHGLFIMNVTNQSCHFRCSISAKKRGIKHSLDVDDDDIGYIGYDDEDNEPPFEPNQTKRGIRTTL
jgi:hypothetical protein